MSDIVATPFRVLWFVVDLVAVLTVVVALIDAAVRPQAAYVAVGKQSKNFWLAVLGLAAVVALVVGIGPLSFLGIAALVAAIVYLVDMRPRLREVRGRGRGGSAGPYGPW